ncbi:hypothetical protein GCM10009648_30210 [Tsukamurella spumae]
MRTAPTVSSPGGPCGGIVVVVDGAVVGVVVVGTVEVVGLVVVGVAGVGAADVVVGGAGGVVGSAPATAGSSPVIGISATGSSSARRIRFLVACVIASSCSSFPHRRCRST